MVLLHSLSAPMLLDGAMGTTLRAHGLPPDTLPELWVLDHPDEVIRVHREHLAAGAEALLTCTLNAHAQGLLGQAGLASLCAQVRREAVRCARAAGGRLVLGLVGPLPPSMPAAAVAAAAEAAAYDLARAGVDALLAETVVNLDEGKARVRGMMAVGLPVAATVVPLTPAAALGELVVRELKAAGADVLGVNCAPPDVCASLVAALQRAGSGPVWAKPSAGQPGEELDPTAFAEGVLRLVAAGASFVGGCCGASPAHVAAVARALGKVPGGPAAD